MKRKIALIILFLTIAVAVALVLAFTQNKPKEEVDVQTQMYNFLLENGFNPVQASGIIATAKQNSGMDCTAVSVPNGECYGLFQWTYVRLENLKRFANANNKNVDEWEIQILFMIEELDPESEYYIGNISYKGYEWDGFWKTQTPNEAAITFNMLYSRPGIFSDRVGEWGEEIYNQYN